MMVDKFKNIKAGVFIKLLSKRTQRNDNTWLGIGEEPTITVDDIGAYILKIPKSLKKDFADDYWITLRYINREMVIATIITLKEGVEESNPNPYLYKECNIRLKKPMTKEEFKYFYSGGKINMDEKYQIDSVKNNRPTDIDGGYVNYDAEWLENTYCWTTFNEIFPMKIISSQRSILNWNKEPWSDVK